MKFGFSSIKLILISCAHWFLIGAPIDVKAQSWTVGMSINKEPIEAFSVPAQEAGLPSVLVVGGFTHEQASTNVVNIGYEAYANEQDNFINVTYLSNVNPAAETMQFPPQGKAYNDNWPSFGLWRWLASHPPDAVVIVGGDTWNLGQALQDDLMGLGTIPVYSIDYENELIEAMRGRKQLPVSSARLSVQARQQRNASELSEGLFNTYLRTPDPLLYISALPLISALRLGKVEQVQSLVDPLIEKLMKAEITSSLQMAGYLLFAELYEHTGRNDYLIIAERAANSAFNYDGSLKEVVPFHGEYSDAIFMQVPLLGKMGKLTGKTAYWDMALRHVDFIGKPLLRKDGLYNHWPSTDAAWGRGNAFVLLGLAEALQDIDENHPAYDALLKRYQQLAATLLVYQDTDGMWHNLIDHPGSWAEFSSTAMIGYALQIGAREQWLEPFYQGVADRAWEGLLTRTTEDFGFIDVCISTPGQDSLQAYLEREALVGQDARAGAMMLLFSTSRL